MIRQPAVAGQFYPGTAAQLKKMIGSFMDKDIEKSEVIGLLAPHAGYVYSGAVAGKVLSSIKFSDTFIILGPNHTGQGKPYSIMTSGSWKTPLGEVKIDTEMAEKILSVSGYLQEDSLAQMLEHSIEVQVPFLQYLKPNVKIVPIILASGPADTYKKIGLEIVRAFRELKREAVIFASSDMNHYEAQAITTKKDNLAIEAVLSLDTDELLKRIEEQRITMCGYAPAVVLMTAANEIGGARAELVKYQTSGDSSGDYDAVVGYAGIIVKKVSPLVKLAKEAAEEWVKKKKVIHPVSLTDEMKEQAGTFVCVKKFGELRGCIGTFEPTTKNVAEEIVSNSIGTVSRDPRFEPVRSSELKDLEYTVDVLTHPEPVSGNMALDPKKYGIIVEAGYRRGLLLPDLEGVDTVDQQIDICRMKAGINPDEPVKLYRFEVKRFK
jgi:MEMO1 family protein